MKLYTEEQMLQAYDAGFQDFKEGLIGRSYYVVESITPIELPSDEDIIKGHDAKEFQFISFWAGAAWYRNQILNQNK